MNIDLGELMEQLELFLSVAVTALSLLITSITFIAKFLKSAKAKKVAEQMLEVTNAILPYIEQAEKFTSYSGKEKKEYVMTKANQYAIEHNIKFKAEDVSAKIEDLVALSKKVNSRDKDTSRNISLTLNKNE